jgi:hypothetical protein
MPSRGNKRIEKDVDMGPAGGNRRKNSTTHYCQAACRLCCPPCCPDTPGTVACPACWRRPYLHAKPNRINLCCHTTAMQRLGIGWTDRGRSEQLMPDSWQLLMIFCRLSLYFLDVLLVAEEQNFLFCSILFHSLIFCIIPFYSILLYSNRIYSILFYFVLFYSIIIYYILFRHILFYLGHRTSNPVLKKNQWSCKNWSTYKMSPHKTSSHKMSPHKT